MLWIKPSNSYILCRNILPLSYIFNSGLPSCQQCVTYHIRQQAIKVRNTPSVTINHAIPCEPFADTGKKSTSHTGMRKGDHIREGFGKNGRTSLGFERQEFRQIYLWGWSRIWDEEQRKEKENVGAKKKMLWFVREWVECVIVVSEAVWVERREWIQAYELASLKLLYKLTNTVSLGQPPLMRKQQNSFCNNKTL